MPVPIGRRGWVLAFLSLLFIGMGALQPVVAALVDSGEGFEVVTGFGGHPKLGCWQPFWVTVPEGESGGEDAVPERFEFTVDDGDGTPVTYWGLLHETDAGSNRYQGYFKPGRDSGSVSLKLLDRAGAVLVEQNVGLGHSGQSQSPSQPRLILKSTQPMVLTLEPSDGLCKTLASMSALSSRDDAMAVVAINSARSLPVDWFCYEGVETIFLVTGDAERIKKISSLQWKALRQWVAQGGRLIFSVSSNSELLLGPDGPLQPFLPGDFSGITEMTRSRLLEAFANSVPLIGSDGDPIAIANLENIRGKVELRQDAHRLVVRSGHGFGEVVFVAFDLDAPRITQWAGYSNLIRRLQSREGVQKTARSQAFGSRGGSVSHYGYNDLIGQLRVPLDRFSGVQFLSFSWVAILIGLYILCIGPGDYFFLKKLTGKMELTWITFPLLSLLFCGLAVGISSVTRPQEIQLNQLEIIDIDADSNRVRGTLWCNLYSPEAKEADIAMGRKNSLGFETDFDLISWHGLPGMGLGGMQTRGRAGLQKTSYVHAFAGAVAVAADAADREGASALSPPSHSVVQGVPLYVAATKPLFARYGGTFPRPIRSKLQLSPGSGRIGGTLINPLDRPLSNVRLLFENYAYVLKRKQLEPGETIDVMTEMKERTVRSLLTRRKRLDKKEAKSQNAPWQKTDARISRIADMLMFYEAAGGENYTGMTHAYQNYVDMSEHLNIGRAILVGQIDTLGTSLELDGEPVSQQYDQFETVVRIVLPVVDARGSAGAANSK